MALIKPEQLASGSYNITGSLFGTSSFALTASYALNAGAGSIDTGSLLITASAVNDTITFTKGDGSTFPVTIDNVASASYALNALSSSYATTASFISTLYSSNHTQSFTNQSTWVVIHNLDTRYVIVQVYDTNFDEIIPQNIDLTNDDTVTISFPTLESGTAVVSVGGALQNNGSISSSYAFSSTSASFALTASYFSGSITNAINAISASYALTASYVVLAQTASYINPTFISASAAAAGFGSGGGTVVVPGNDTEVLFNNAGNLGASSGFKFDPIYLSLSHGNSNLALGAYSHAEGNQTTASSNASHAEGQNTKALGSGAHAEGQDTIAEGGFSHTEGSLTYAPGNYSHAEGYRASASANYSHAEGINTKALGLASHVEGGSTQAIGEGSHAEGQSTLAQGGSSHAEGLSTISSGDFSHTEGYGSEAVGYASHAEGYFTVASGSYQHVQGMFNTHGDTTSLMIVGNGNPVIRRDAFKVRISGSIVLPTTQSTAPSWTGTDGEIVPATVGGQYFLYMWMNGAWRSGSFV